MKRLLTLMVLAALVASCASCGIKNDPSLPPADEQAK